MVPRIWSIWSSICRFWFRIWFLLSRSPSVRASMLLEMASTWAVISSSMLWRSPLALSVLTRTMSIRVLVSTCSSSRSSPKSSTWFTVFLGALAASQATSAWSSSPYFASCSSCSSLFFSHAASSSGWMFSTSPPYPFSISARRAAIWLTFCTAAW